MILWTQFRRMRGKRFTMHRFPCSLPTPFSNTPFFSWHSALLTLTFPLVLLDYPSAFFLPIHLVLAYPPFLRHPQPSNPMDAVMRSFFLVKAPAPQSRSIVFVTQVRTGIKGMESGNTLTNRELLMAFDPRSNSLPYVYDNFKWTHCEADGFDFDDAWKAQASTPGHRRTQFKEGVKRAPMFGVFEERRAARKAKKNL